MRIGSVSGIAGRGDFSLIRPVPDAETLPNKNVNFECIAIAKHIINLNNDKLIV